MTTLAQLRKAALSYPETAEHVTGPGIVAFTVREKRFASMGTENLVELRSPGRRQPRSLPRTRPRSR